MNWEKPDIIATLLEKTSNDKIIWMYWENAPGKQKPEYLNLCLLSIKAKRGSFELRLLDEHSAKEWVSIPDEVWQFEQIAHRADYIRSRLLYLYGGFWLDSDMILMRNLDQVLKEYIQREDTRFLGFGESVYKPRLPFMYARKGSEVCRQWAEKQNQVLMDNGWKVPGWTGIGADLLWQIDAGVYDKEAAFIPMSLILPFQYKKWKYLLSDTISLKKAGITENTITVSCFNQMLPASFKEKNKEEILQGNSLFSRILVNNVNLEIAEFPVQKQKSKKSRGKLIIGLGTGRSGTKSLAYLLNNQKQIKSYHEFGKNLPWKVDEQALLENLSQLKASGFNSDIAFYYLSYVEYIINYINPNAKFIALQRDRDTTIRSYVEKAGDRNHWMEHSGKRWKIGKRWDKSYPKFKAKNRKEAIGMYYDHYYALVRELQEKYPRNVRLYQTQDLNKEEKVRDILEFCEIKNPVVLTNIRANRTKKSLGKRFVELFKN